MNWQDFFETVPDFRLNRRKKHQLTDILVIALCAMISGADDFEEIESYGKRKQAFLETFLALPNGIPSHDTFNRVFRLMDKKAFGETLYRWSAEILALLNSPTYQVNIDGKVLRATAKVGARKSGLCIVSAWVAQHELVLGEQKVDEKSNEKSAIPLLLKSLDLEGALVSSDAAGCQLSNADLIVERGGHYLIALKKDHKHIYEQVSERMKAIKEQLPSQQWMDFGSGRIEKRTCYVCNHLRFFDDLAEWTHLKTTLMVVSSREKAGVITEETRFYLSSLDTTPKAFNAFIRKHWSIENQLHWHLDVVFKEDTSRLRTQNAAQNMATLRKMALQALNRVEDKESIKNRRKIAGWDDKYLLSILLNI